MQVYLTPKDVAERLQVNVDTARNEMRKMRHTTIGGENRQMLRVSEKDFEAYMQPDPPLPKASAMRRRGHNARPTDPKPNTIPYRKTGR